MTFLDRYLRGDHEQVWADLRELGPEARTDDARAVAIETMRRVRRNVEAVRARLDAAGYAFQEPDQAHVPPTPEADAELDVFEQQHGPLPLSLRAFYEIVGTVNFIQSWDQLVQQRRREQSADPVPEILYAGEFDPLAVEAPVCAYAKWKSPFNRRAWPLALDECHKANYSGGENYAVLLPDAGADFRIYGMISNEEDMFGDWFVDYLRETFRGGGFRGTVDGDEFGIVGRRLPELRITRELAEGLDSL
ncbi:hypothetical protein [Paractinoplanes lichenicola]|uniref:Knr4/Smi1-like domain-containing protein n=1 Tax=Paractinoplanes lichenicola TaxID=2802976 RepID=A0ABS1VEX1_9ACTN|nr:hypothetical protein [Actinoplanes lichenicola]MBL7252704.1 hypothetical protein [Actinoplanes lichenicola]